MNSRFAVAVHTLVFLGHAGGRPVTSEEIACSVNTNPVVIRRILGSLRDHGLVVSRAGPGGGWQMVGEPDSISLHDAYQAVETESLFGLPEREPDPSCRVGAHVQQIFDRLAVGAEQVMASYFQQLTIADVIQRVANADVPREHQADEAVGQAG